MITVEKAEEIIQHKMHEVAESLGHLNQFNYYILQTLDSFAYRYFDKPNQAELLTNDVLRVIGVEKGRADKGEASTIAKELRVHILQRGPGHGGNSHIMARISFAHPNHHFEPGTYSEKMSVLKFEDDIYFRNNLAKHLEKVCELFDQ